MEERISLDRTKSLIFLTAALVMTVTWAVGASGWTKGLNVITFVGLGAILIGMMLARSILPALIAHTTGVSTPVVVVSAKSALTSIQAAFTLGAADFLTKPFDFEEFSGRIKIALFNHMGKGM